MEEILALLKAICSKLGIVTPLLSGATPAPWWKPLADAYSTFAKKMGVTVSSLMPWEQNPDGSTTGTAFPMLPPATAEADILEYGGFGFGPDGKQRLFTAKGFADARRVCDLLAAATTPAEADRVLTGAGAPGVEPNAVRLALMTGLVTLNPFDVPRYGGWLTVGDVATVLTYVPSYPTGGPGPSGQPA